MTSNAQWWKAAYWVLCSCKSSLKYALAYNYNTVLLVNCKHLPHRQLGRLEFLRLPQTRNSTHDPTKSRLVFCRSAEWVSGSSKAPTADWHSNWPSAEYRRRTSESTAATPAIASQPLRQRLNYTVSLTDIWICYDSKIASFCFSIILFIMCTGVHCRPTELWRMISMKTLNLHFVIC